MRNPCQLLYASSIKTILLGKVALDSPARRHSQTDGDDALAAAKLQHRAATLQMSGSLDLQHFIRLAAGPLYHQMDEMQLGDHRRR